MQFFVAFREERRTIEHSSRMWQERGRLQHSTAQLISHDTRSALPCINISFESSQSPPSLTVTYHTPFLAIYLISVLALVSALAQVRLPLVYEPMTVRPGESTLLTTASLVLGLIVPGYRLELDLICCSTSSEASIESLCLRLLTGRYSIYRVASTHGKHITEQQNITSRTWGIIN
jgi:hypothetical protein